MQMSIHNQALHIRSFFTVIIFRQNTPASYVQGYITTTMLHPQSPRKIKSVAVKTAVVESAINSIVSLCRNLYTGTLQNNGNLLNNNFLIYLYSEKFINYAFTLKMQHTSVFIYGLWLAAAQCGMQIQTRLQNYHMQ